MDSVSDLDMSTPGSKVKLKGIQDTDFGMPSCIAFTIWELLVLKNDITGKKITNLNLSQRAKTMLFCTI